MSPARALAAEVLAGPVATVAGRLDRALSGNPLVAEDRALLAEIVNGTVRMRRRLASALEPLAARGTAGLAPRVRAILESAAYQILFLERVPAYAAVNDAVELARQAGHERASGFVNAVLRALASRQSAAAPDGAGDADGAASRAASPADAVAALGVEHSYPDWIVRRVVDLIGREEAAAFLASGNAVPPLTLRANRRRGGRAALLARLAADGIAAAPCDRAADGVRLAGRPFLASLGALLEGLASVQDESAMLVTDLVAPAPGETIVDLCASPGGKALAIAERVEGAARVVAVDRAARLPRLRENARRLGLARVEIVAGDALTLPPIASDAVLVDAPCSGLGVLRRHADLRWTKRNADIARLAAIQGAILDAAARWVAPGGRLVYSTCSILPDENEHVVVAFLLRHPEFSVATLPDGLAALAADETPGFLRTWPHRHATDGSFACRLERSAP